MKLWTAFGNPPMMDCILQSSDHGFKLSEALSFVGLRIDFDYMHRFFKARFQETLALFHLFF